MATSIAQNVSKKKICIFMQDIDIYLANKYINYFGRNEYEKNLSTKIRRFG